MSVSSRRTGGVGAGNERFVEAYHLKDLHAPTVRVGVAPPEAGTARPAWCPAGGWSCTPCVANERFVAAYHLDLHALTVRVGAAPPEAGTARPACYPAGGWKLHALHGQEFLVCPAYDRTRRGPGPRPSRPSGPPRPARPSPVPHAEPRPVGELFPPCPSRRAGGPPLQGPRGGSPQVARTIRGILCIVRAFVCIFV